MAYIVCKAPGVCVDLMVRKEYWPKLVSHIQRCSCTYEKEVEVDLGDGNEWLCVKDIRSMYGYELGTLLGLFYGMEWDNMTKNGAKEEKYYLLINNRKREKKNDGKTGSETDAGSIRGAVGKSAGNTRFGPNSGHRGEAPNPRAVSPDSMLEHEIRQNPDDDCE